MITAVAMSQIAQYRTAPARRAEPPRFAPAFDRTLRILEPRASRKLEPAGELVILAGTPLAHICERHVVSTFGLRAGDGAVQVNYPLRFQLASY